MNLFLIFNILSYFLMVFGVTMLLPLGVALFYREPEVLVFSGSLAAVFLSGLLLQFYLRFGKIDRAAGPAELVHKDGFLIVTLSWVLFALGGSLPFYISGAMPSFVDAVFESMSGFTTTGASILTDIESLRRSVLFWRSFIQWLGGMGIVVFSIALLPLLGVGGMQMFKAEVPGPTADKFTPRIKHTAEMLWLVYAALTLGEILLLWAGDMSLFDAVNHAFTTMATGGFSTRNHSILDYHSTYINLVIVVFMLLAGVNFNLYLKIIHGRLRSVFHDEELRFYLGFVAVLTLIIAVTLILRGDLSGGRALEHSLFTTVSIMTTTGYATLDFDLWPHLARALLLLAMFLGGMAGSTGGGVKTVRIVVLLKNARYELRRMLHPQAVFRIKLGKRQVADSIIANITGFLALFIMILVAATLAVSAGGVDLVTSFSAVLAALSNIGPGLGGVGPTANYAFLNDYAKLVLTACMLLGRLELFTVLVIFTRGFWKV